MQSSKGLGRGLDSLIPMSDGTETTSRPNNTKDTINELRVSEIIPNPHQPRKNFNEESMKELAHSIKLHGIIQPLVVSKENDKYILIAGERRLRASRLAGLEKVPVILRSTEEQERLELALIENLQREDLNVLEEAFSYKKLMDEFNITQEEVSRKVGKSRSAVANILRLLGLPVEVKRGLREGLITEGHARAILSLSNIEEQLALYSAIISGKLNVRQTELKAKGNKGERPEVLGLSIELKNLEGEFTKTIGSKVKIQKKGVGGKIIIEYYSDEELERIARKIVGNEKKYPISN